MTASQLDSIDRLSGCFEREIDEVELDSVVVNESWPTAGALIAHVGGVYRWVAATLVAGHRAAHDPSWRPAPGHEQRWFADARATLIDQLAATDPDRACWTLAGDGRAGFWSRRMLLETLMHLGDLRTAGGRAPEPVREVDQATYADGIDEHLHLFLDRSRPTLTPLTRALVLAAGDSPRQWLIGTDWTISVDPDTTPKSATMLSASTADLALFAWDRLNPLNHTDRFTVLGDPAVLAEYRAAPIHP